MFHPLVVFVGGAGGGAPDEAQERQEKCVCGRGRVGEGGGGGRKGGTGVTHKSARTRGARGEGKTEVHL